MSNTFLIGLDIGSSGGRCLLLNANTTETFCTTTSWKHSLIPGSIGFYDLNTDDIWRSLTDAIRSCLIKAQANPKEIAGIAISSVRYGIVVVDQEQKVIFAAPNIDGRAAMHGSRLAAEHGQEFFEKTGHWPNAVLPGVRLHQLIEEGGLQRAHAFLSIGDWFAMRLSGKIATDTSQASGTMLFDIGEKKWNIPLAKKLDIPSHILPQVHNSGYALSGLRSEIAVETGLLAGTPIIVGGADSQMSLLGTNAIQPGQICVVGGSTAPIQMVMKKPNKFPQLWTECHVLPDLWVMESNAGPVGTSLEFIAKVLYQNKKNAVAMLCAEAKESQVGASGIVSTLGTGIFDATEMNVPLGHLTLAPMIYPDANSYRPHVCRGVVEGLAYGIQANLESLAKQHPVADIFLTGGMSSSSLWGQILSDLNNKVVQVSDTTQTSALGAAICAGVGVGIFDSLANGAQKIVKSTKRYTPNVEKNEIYQSLFSNWKSVIAKNKESDQVVAQTILQAISENPETEVSNASIFRPKIYVSADMDVASIEQLKKIGDVTYRSYRSEMQLLTGDLLIETLKDYHVFISEVDVLDAEVLQKLPSLKAVISCRSNAVNIDIEACSLLGIPVINTPGRNATAVADLTVSFMLMLARKMPQAIEFLHQKDVEAGDMARMGMAHEQLQGAELWRKKVGLIGMGAVGRKVIERLLPFEVDIFVYDPYLSAEDIAATGATSICLSELLQISDFISLHAAVTDESRGLLGQAEFAKMKKSCFIVNTARSALIDEKALISALEQELIGGIALDVFSIEPPGADHPLLAFKNVIATPHVAGNTYEVAAHQGEIVIAELRKLLANRSPSHVRNPQVMKFFSWTIAERILSKEDREKLDNRAAPAITDLDKEANDEEENQESAKTKGVFSKIRKIVTTRKTQNPTTHAKIPEIHEKVEKSSEEKSEKASLEKIIREFLQTVALDSALQKFCAKQDILVQYVIPDSEQYFVVHYQKGNVLTCWGKADKKPNVTLKMKAVILDGILSGKINGVRAAMTGKLSFSGDTLKAMRLQKIEKDMIRLYCNAREKIGDPGDLTQVNSAKEVEKSLKPTAEISKMTTVSATPKTSEKNKYMSNDERDEVVAMFDELYQAGLITSTGGNVSVRVSNHPEHVWITPSQVYKGGLDSSMIVKVDLDGNQLGNDSYNASSERHLHTLIMKNRPEITSVIHSHAPKATSLALSEYPFLPISTEAVFVGEIPRVPFIMPGSKDLAKEVAAAIGKGTAVLMQNHGLVVAAGSLRQAADLTYIIEQTSEKILTCYAAGKKPQTLPEDAIEMLRSLGEMII